MVQSGTSETHNEIEQRSDTVEYVRALTKTVGIDTIDE